MRYFFTSTNAPALCSMNITKSVPSGAFPGVFSPYVAAYDADLDLNCRNVFLESGGVVRDKNNIQLEAGSSGTSGYVRFRVLSCDYFPARIYVGYIGDIALNDYNFHEYYVGAGVRADAYPNPTYGSGNTITMYGYDPCYSCNGSCFTAGSTIFMADGSWKNIENIAKGDLVIGIDGRPSEVLAPYKVKLGHRRSILTFPDYSLTWSGEHLLWVRTVEGEYFGTHDYHQYCREKTIYTIDGIDYKYQGLTKREPFIITAPAEYAHIDGWKLQEPRVAREYGDDTYVYSMVVSGSHTYIVNGYVATGFVDDCDFDYSKIHWQGLPKYSLRSWHE